MCFRPAAPGMCALIGYRRGPGPWRTSPSGHIRNKSSPFAKALKHLLLFVCMRLLYTRGSWLKEQKLDQPAAMYKEMLATGRVAQRTTPSGSVAQGLRLETGRWHREARRAESVVARLKPDHTRSMAMGCSTITHHTHRLHPTPPGANEESHNQGWEIPRFFSGISKNTY